MTNTRPLSPHLQIYKPQLTSMLSILHRATGIFLALSTVAFAYWLQAVAGGPETYATAKSLFASWYGQLALLAWSYSFYYHLCNGIRHLFWDAGYGFELEQVYLSGWIVLVVSLGLTAISWILAYTEILT